MRLLFEKGPPCAIGRTLPNGNVAAIFCRYGGWLRDGGAADVLSRDYATEKAAAALIGGGHIVGVERGQKPIAVPYLAGGVAMTFDNDANYRQHFTRYGVSFFLLWREGSWFRSRPGLATDFSAWCPVVGRHTKQRRAQEPAE